MRNKILVVFLFCGLSFAKTAPQFQGDLMAGGRFSLKEKLKPGRALMVCFWATWCVPCIQELKEVTTYLKNHPDANLDMIGVNVDTSETATDVKPTMKLYGYDFPVILDPNQANVSKYQTAKTLPFSALLTSKGEIAETFSGYSETMFKKVEEVLQQEKTSSGKP